ncbi:MAG: lysylphosphatidylglycerol synthase transmembrane domain-containing protein [Thermodesulfovibrionaceae bacterium]
MRNYLKFLIRLLITTVLIFFLFQKLNFSEFYQALKKSNLIYIVFASFLYLLSSYISTLRWKIFISSSKIKISELFSLYLIGSFFNITLPGIVSGDIVKILMIRDKVNLREAIFSIFMDRYIGFSVLLFVGFIFFLIFYPKLPKSWILWSVPISFLGFILFSLFLYILVNFRFLKEFRSLLGCLKKNQIFITLILSLFIQFCVIFSVYVVTKSINLELSFFKIAIFLPVIILITTLPISISGVGVREWCFLLFFEKFIPPEKAMATSVLWFASVVFASLIGGFEYLRLKKKSLNIEQK